MIHQHEDGEERGLGEAVVNDGEVEVRGLDEGRMQERDSSTREGWMMQ